MSDFAAFIVKKAKHVWTPHRALANIDISAHTDKFLWVVFAIMLISTIVIFAVGSRRPINERAFHELAAAICFTASISYFAMASDYGATPVVVEYIRGGSLGRDWVKAGVLHPTRSVWYARYIDWTITTPLLLLELAFATGLPLSQVFTLIFLDIIMIVTGLVGALISSGYKWGFFTFGCVALVLIWYILLVPGRASAARLGSDYHKAYLTSTVILSTLWLLYPIAWAIADGGNAITPTSEMVFYGILDVLAKPVYCTVHVIGIAKLDYSRFGFSAGKSSDGASAGLLSNAGSSGQYGATDGRSSTAPRSSA